MKTCPICFVQWSGNHNCTHTHIPTTYNHHNHTVLEPGCYPCERRRLSKELRAKASQRFSEYGVKDARAAAIWDVANWLIESDEVAHVS